MKKFLLLAVSLFVTSFAFAQQLQPINRIVAVVNDNAITALQLNKQVEFAKANMHANHSQLPSENDLRQQVLNQMINQQLQLQIAKRNGIQVDDSDVTKAIQSIANRNNETTRAFYASIAKMGLNKAEFRQQISDQLIINHLQRQAVASKIAITPQEVNAFLLSNQGQQLDNTQYHVANILVTIPNAPTAAQITQAQQQAQTIVKAAKAGKDFNALAIAHSKASNALQGGDLGWKTLLEMPTVFAKQVINLNINGVAGPIRTANGFYILKLLGTRAQKGTQAMSPAQLKQAAENAIFQAKLQQRLQSWILQLRASAYVKVMPQ